MKSISYIFSILIIVFICACSSDPCADINCLNGGMCNEGTCDCPSGWVGADCSVFDFEYLGRYSSTSFVISDCNDGSAERSGSANSDEEYCLTNTDGSQDCLRLTLILEEDNMARWILVSTLRTATVRLANPTVSFGTFSTNNEIINVTGDDIPGGLIFTVKEDRSGLVWIQNGTDGCILTHDFTRS